MLATESWQGAAQRSGSDFSLPLALMQERVLEYDTARYPFQGIVLSRIQLTEPAAAELPDVHKLDCVSAVLRRGAMSPRRGPMMSRNPILNMLRNALRSDEECESRAATILYHPSLPPAACALSFAHPRALPRHCRARDVPPFPAGRDPASSLRPEPAMQRRARPAGLPAGPVNPGPSAPPARGTVCCPAAASCHTDRPHSRGCMPQSCHRDPLRARKLPRWARKHRLGCIATTSTGTSPRRSTSGCR